jgi:hypothetical protein
MCQTGQIEETLVLSLGTYPTIRAGKNERLIHTKTTMQTKGQ